MSYQYASHTVVQRTHDPTSFGLELNLRYSSFFLRPGVTVEPLLGVRRGVVVARVDMVMLPRVVVRCQNDR